MGVLSVSFALGSWKLTHKPHRDVTQDEEQEEDTADDVCTAPGEETDVLSWGV